MAKQIDNIEICVLFIVNFCDYTYKHKNRYIVRFVLINNRVFTIIYIFIARRYA